MKLGNRIFYIGILALSLAPAISFAAEITTALAAHVTQLTGSSTAEAINQDGASRKLVMGDALYSGEKIRTGKNTGLSMNFEDKSKFTLGSNTEFLIETFKFQQNTEDSFQSKVLKGAFRFISGLIAHHSAGQHMNVRTPVATIGIRGTHVEGEVTGRQEKDGVNIDASARIVLLEPEEDGQKTAIIVSNEFGSVTIDKPGYGTEIPDEKSPPSPVRRMQINTIEDILRSVHNVARQAGTPRPR